MASESSKPTPDQVTHDPTNHRFVLKLGPGGEKDEGVIDYQEVDSNTWDMFHTYTPPNHRGKGVAETVTTAAIETARKEGKKVVASCWYVKGYLDARPELAKQVEATR